ncbi:MAG: hypothetical protein ACLPOO_16715 [Terriglobales bacterium]
MNDEAIETYKKVVKKDPKAVRPALEPVPVTRRLSDYFGDEDKRQFALWLHSLSTTPLGQSVRHEFIFGMPGVVSVMLGNWKKDVDAATTFWSQVLNESNPDPDHDSRVLAYDLSEMRKKLPRKTQKDFRKLAAKLSRKFNEQTQAVGA